MMDYAWKELLNARNPWMPGKRSDVERALTAVNSSARKLKADITKLGRLSAPIRFESLPRSSGRTVTVQNVPRETRHYMAISKPGTWSWPDYIDLEAVLDRVMMNEVHNEVLAGFDEIYPIQISRPNARAHVLAKVLLQSTNVYFKRPPYQAISDTVAAFYPRLSLINFTRRLRRLRTEI
jgi:hypothetical protein